MLTATNLILALDIVIKQNLLHMSFFLNLLHRESF